MTGTIIMSDEKEIFDLASEKFQGLWDPDDPDNSDWMQRPDEKSLWYKRFRSWLLQGRERTVIKEVNAWREDRGKDLSDKIPASWYKYKKEYDWDLRADAFDAAVDAVKIEVWAGKRVSLLEMEWDMAMQLRDRFVKMLDFPLQEVVRGRTKLDDGTFADQVIIKPVKWTQRDMVQIAKAVSELGRLTVGMPTEHSLVEGEKGAGVMIYIPENGRTNKEFDPESIQVYNPEDLEDRTNGTGNQAAT